MAIFLVLVYNIYEMREKLLPVLNQEFPGLSDPTALRAEVAEIQTEIAATTQQLTVERACAKDVIHARMQAIASSPALRLVFETDDKDPHLEKPDYSMDRLLSAVFRRKVVATLLPDGFSHTTGKELRTKTHPDLGGDSETAKEVGQFLESINNDPSFSVASAMLKASRQQPTGLEQLRDERYRLTIVKQGLTPIFESEEAAVENAQKEISGAQWRVRADAALLTVDLLLGGNDIWNAFLNSIARGNNPSLVSTINQVQPELLSLQERIYKGDPLAADQLHIDSIDAVFERIWSTIKSKDSPLPYSPPYQNWIEILLPAMRKLDPGKKPGEEYTFFEPPFKVTRMARTPSPRLSISNENQNMRQKPFSKSHQKHFYSDNTYNKEKYTNKY